MSYPFKQVVKDGIIYRKFTNRIDEHELEWHVDEHDRVVVPIKNTGWKFQFENKLPEELKVGKQYFIKKENWHRVIVGTGDLILAIREVK